MAAAIAAAERGSRVTVLEANDAPGRKILATGNGRCNYTNMHMSADDYHGGRDTAAAVTGAFDTEDALIFMESCGIYPHMRNGYVYPRSDRADAVRDALVRRMESLGVNVITGCHADEIARVSGGYKVLAGSRTFRCDRLIIAAGSRASEIPGSDGSGYSLVKSLGHSLVPVLPALVGLKTDMKAAARAAGVRTECRADLYIDGSPAGSETGEIQFTKGGISGIPVLQLSRTASAAIYQGRDVRLRLDFLPELSAQEAGDLITVNSDLTGLLPSKLLDMITAAGQDMSSLKDFEIHITDTMGFEAAQVCSGGVRTDETDPLTCESLIAPGVYITGELLDVDGACGGYNLHFAIATGVLAGCAAAGVPYEKRQPSAAQSERWARSEIGSRRR